MNFPEKIPNDYELPTNNFSRFELFLEELGLPRDNVIAEEEERLRVMRALPEFVQSLSPGIKRDARYLSKFIAGSAVGLFDAALNYVWNEVIINLRSKVVVYGLDIFFDAAVGEKVREQYQTEEDLKGIKDKTLLDTCRKLELISDIVYKKLSHILTMRNDIGASPPNTYCINSYELLGWLQTCINDVLQVEPSSAAITIKSVIDNLKRATQELDQDIIESFSESIKDISSEMTANLLVTLFGIYTSEDTDRIVRENIIKLAPIVWEHCTDNVKYDLGEKIDLFKANLDTKKKEYGESFFEICDGNRYLSLSSKIIKLSSLCDELLDANRGWDNYYHEPPIARQIMSYIKKAEDIPEERQEKLIKTFLICRIGREVDYRHGVSPGAKNYYDHFFKILDKNQIINLINLLEEYDVRTKLTGGIRRSNMVEILEIIKSPILGDRLSEIIEFLINNKNHLYNVFDMNTYKQLTKGIVKN